MWISVEVEEDGHDQAPGKYERILENMGGRPGLLVRINPDNPDRKMFKRRVIPTGPQKGQILWTSTDRFQEVIEEVQKILDEVGPEPMWHGTKEVIVNF
jgi:hypothetical protein